MKRMTLALFAFGMAFQLSAQQATTEPVSLEADYLNKSRSQTAGGALLLGAGAIGLSASLIADINQSFSGIFVTVMSVGTATSKSKSYTIPYLLSASAMIGGIVLLAEGSKNKRKAKLAHVFIDMEKSKLLKSTGPENTTLPVIGLKIQL